MEGNVRPETMERINSKELAEEFINDGEIVLTAAADELRNSENASIDEIFRRMFKC